MHHLVSPSAPTFCTPVYAIAKASYTIDGGR
jgi:hypothetical protein